MTFRHDSHELKAFTSNNQITDGTSQSRDEVALARLGKKPVLKRNFGFMSILGFSCTVLITWEGSLILFLVALQNGGPAGVIYGYLLVWLGTVSVFAVLSELVSMAPTAGGQYHWVSMLAPPSSQKFLSYITGWLTTAGWQATVGSGGYLTGTLIQGLIVQTNPDYDFKLWHGTLLYWAVILFAVFINTILGSLLPKVESMILVLHILGFFAILIPLVVLGHHGDATSIFTTFSNSGGWSTQGLSFCIGLLGNVFAFVGGDGAIHMSEEIRNAPTVVPWSIMIGLFINGTLGFAMMLAILFCFDNLALKENPVYPFMAVFHRAVHSVTGAAVMASLVVVLAMFATVGILASASRMFWAFSRDRGLPGWRVLQKISPRTSIPVYAVLTTTVIACLLALVNIGSSTAFNGVISISIAGLFASYLLVAALLLYRRCTGGIALASSLTGSMTNTADATLTWGPWRLPGILGIINNVFACTYLLFIFFFSFWPSYADVTPQTMNWSILVTGFVFVFSVVYYLVWARRTYKGPIVEID